MGKQIFIFGDSITYGAWDVQGGWVARLRNYLDKKVLSSDYKEFYLVYNLGVSGDTSENVLNRFQNEIEQRFDPAQKTILLLAVGTNDAVFDSSKNAHAVSIEEFGYNVQNIIHQSKKYTSKIIVISLSPVDESKVNPIPWAPLLSSKNSYIEKYNIQLQDVCKKNKILFVDIYSALENHPELLADGDHPNSDGHKKMFEVIKNYLIEQKMI